MDNTMAPSLKTAFSKYWLAAGTYYMFRTVVRSRASTWYADLIWNRLPQKHWHTNPLQSLNHLSRPRRLILTLAWLRLGPSQLRIGTVAGNNIASLAHSYNYISYVFITKTKFILPFVIEVHGCQWVNRKGTLLFRWQGISPEGIFCQTSAWMLCIINMISRVHLWSAAEKGCLCFADPASLGETKTATEDVSGNTVFLSYITVWCLLVLVFVLSVVICVEAER